MHGLAPGPGLTAGPPRSIPILGYMRFDPQANFVGADVRRMPDGTPMGSSGGSLRICGLNETVNEIFEISGFSVILNVFGTEEEAMQGF